MFEILGIRRIHSNHGPHVTDIYVFNYTDNHKLFHRYTVTKRQTSNLEYILQNQQMLQCSITATNLDNFNPSKTYFPTSF